MSSTMKYSLRPCQEAKIQGSVEVFDGHSWNVIPNARVTHIGRQTRDLMHQTLTSEFDMVMVTVEDTSHHQSQVNDALDHAVDGDGFRHSDEDDMSYSDTVNPPTVNKDGPVDLTPESSQDNAATG